MVVTINGRLTSLNEYINAERRNKFIAAKLKKEAEEMVSWQIKSMSEITQASFFSFEWHLSNKKRDPDNVSSYGRKVILDAMVKLGKLPNDNLTWIIGFKDTFVVDKTDKVIVTISQDTL
jgi:hypothetical protein